MMKDCIFYFFCRLCSISSTFTSPGCPLSSIDDGIFGAMSCSQCHSFWQRQQKQSGTFFLAKERKGNCFGTLTALCPFLRLVCFLWLGKGRKKKARSNKEEVTQDPTKCVKLIRQFCLVIRCIQHVHRYNYNSSNHFYDLEIFCHEKLPMFFGRVGEEQVLFAELFSFFPFFLLQPTEGRGNFFALSVILVLRRATDRPTSVSLPPPPDQEKKR